MDDVEIITEHLLATLALLKISVSGPAPNPRSPTVSGYHRWPNSYYLIYKNEGIDLTIGVLYIYHDRMVLRDIHIQPYPDYTLYYCDPKFNADTISKDIIAIVNDKLNKIELVSDTFQPWVLPPTPD